MGDNPLVGDGGRLDDVNLLVGDGGRLDDVNPFVGDGGRLDDINPLVGDGGRLDGEGNEVLPAAARWWERVRSNWKWVAVAVGGIIVIYYLWRRISRLEKFVVDMAKRTIVMSMVWERSLDFQKSRRHRRNWRRRRRRN